MSTLYKKSINLVDISCTSTRNGYYILKLTVSRNQRGIIYRVSAALFAHGWNIREAIAETVQDGMVKDVFIIENLRQQKMTEHDLQVIHEDLIALINGEISVVDYFIKMNADPGKHRIDFLHQVTVFNPSNVDSTVLDIRTMDRPGLLFEITLLLFIFNVDIISFTARIEEGEVRDSFLLRDSHGNRLDEDTSLRLKAAILKVI